MDKRQLEQINLENAETICAKIRQDAEQEVSTILGRARQEADKLISQAKTGAEASRAAMMAEADKEIQKIKERIFSTLNLEKKRLLLEEKSRFVSLVIDAAKGRAQSLRQDNGYSAFLSEAILEGIDVVETDSVMVYYSSIDERIFNEAFVQAAEKSCLQRLSRHCGIMPKKSDFKDIGVIVSSADGRMMYDNRFSARLERIAETLYMELLKEAL